MEYFSRSFSHIEDFGALKRALYVRRDIPRESISSVININTNTYNQVITFLRTLGFTREDEYRIFRYKSGAFRFTNKAEKLPHKLYDLKADYFKITQSLLDNYQVPTFLTNDNGIVIPFYYSEDNEIWFTFMEDSEFYLKGDKVFVAPSILKGIQFLTDGQATGDNIETLYQLIKDTDTKYIIITGDMMTGTNRIYNINGEMLKLIPSKFKEETIIKAMKKLDLINQPYEKEFLYKNGTIDRRLDLMLKIPDVTYILNVLGVQTFVEGDSDTYRKLGFSNICHIVNLQLFTKDNTIISNPTSKQISEIKRYVDPSIIFSSISNCQYDILIMGISMVFESGPGHQTVLILNKNKQNGYLFDPSIISGRTKYMVLGVYAVHDMIIDYLKLNLQDTMPNLDIKPSSNFGCLYPYSLQAEAGGSDLYCMAWSFYLSILYLLNMDKDFETIVDYLYDIGEAKTVIIPRFLLWLYGDEPKAKRAFAVYL